MKFLIPTTIPRAALITGGARQRAMALALSDAGFAVALQCQVPADGDPSVGDVPPGIIPLPADLSDEAQTAGLLVRAVAAIGPIGVLINAAGTTERDTWDEPNRATWDMHIETNLRAPFVLIQHFAKALPLGREGVVINLLDQRVCPQLVSYTLSKAALWSLTQTMALALAPSIRVNGIAPGQVQAASRGTITGYEEAEAREIARAAIAILALTSMTGQMIVPDGVPPVGS